MEQTERSRQAKQSKPKWIPPKERKWVLASLVAALLIMLMGLWGMLQISPSAYHTRIFKASFMNYGALARIALFAVLANYVLTLIIQKRLVDPWNTIKRGFILLLRFARKWHTPIAIIAIGLIVLHVVGAFLYGFEFDFHNISGLLALIALLPVPIAGLFRYRRMDRKWHLRLGIGFAVLFIIHAFI